jgi:undecaprenyl-diphosphatase
MNFLRWFDICLLMSVNQLAQKSRLFDRLICGFEGEPLAKGGVLTAFLWWAWFRRSADKARDRAILVSGVISAMGALAVSRIAAFCLPFRERPIFVAALRFRAPIGTNSSTLIDWSSFPSDHAALYFSLATVVFFVSRRAGALAYLYTVLFICLPRLYLGDHYPTDLIGGTVIGIAMSIVSTNGRVRESLARIPLQMLEAVPSCFYVVVYLGSFLLANNFDPIRKLGSLVFDSFKTHGVL